MSEVRLQRLRTQGVLEFNGQQVPIENNVWLLGNDEDVWVIDAAHHADEIATAVGNRTTLGILLTHGHQDHVNAAPELAQVLGAPLYLHDDDLFLWRETHSSLEPERSVQAGDTFTVGNVTLRTVHTPGHTPGSVCFIADDHGVVLSGDTLFQGGPGATRWEYSSFPQIIESIQQELMVLPHNFTVLPGHGEGTTIEAEQENLQLYIDRGW